MAARFSVIIPAPSLSPPPAGLPDLANAGPDVEVLIATGSNPSRQRNIAAAHARGEWLVFLDSDCRIQPDHFRRIGQHAAEGLQLLGGPVLLTSESSPREQIFQQLLGHPLLTGASSSRYRQHGSLRQCGDAELILCNLAVERGIFTASGGFDERLYPNEENEWMIRLRANGVSCWHDPQLVVRRPQRKSWSAYVRMLLGYGRGRTRQFVVSGRWDVGRQMPLLALLAWLTLLAWKPRLALSAGLAGWLALSGAAKARAKLDGGAAFGTMAALAAPSVPILYAIGQMAGFAQSFLLNPLPEPELYRWTPGCGTLVPVVVTKTTEL